MHDMLRETPIYQEILKESHEEGLSRACNKGSSRPCARRSSMSWWSASRSWYD